jgi:tetratricopeptide (TPR) repeat protein
MRERRVVAVAAGVVIALGGLVWFGVALGKDYSSERVDEWCRHARALDEAKLRDRAYVAYRSLHNADDACDASAELADLRFWMARREQLLEGARAFRRAATLRRAGIEGREEALRDAFSAYQDALEIDPFARGARQAFVQLVATYRRIEPAAPDCTRSRGVAGAGLLPEARLYLSRALRARENGICRAGLTWLGRRRAAAYQHLRVAQAREAAGDHEGARAAYAAALRADSSQRQALTGLERARPAPLVEESDWADDIWDFMQDVLAVVPSAIWALIVWVVGALALFALLWKGAKWLAASDSVRAQRLVDRIPVLRRAPDVHVETEGTADLPPEVGGIIDDTLAQLRARRVDAATGRVRAGLSASPRGSSYESEAAFTAVPPVAFAEQILRFGASLLRERSDYVLVLEHAGGGNGNGNGGSGTPDGQLVQRWRIIDRHTRRTLERLEVTEQDFPITPPTDKRVSYFSIVAGEALRGAIVKAEAQLSRPS